MRNYFINSTFLALFNDNANFASIALQKKVHIHFRSNRKRIYTVKLREKFRKTLLDCSEGNQCQRLFKRGIV